MEWTEVAIRKLRTLWDEGLPTAKIGLRLGCSKSAVVGKAHRLDLPTRGSPIKRDGVAAPKPDQRQHGRRRGPTLPPLASMASSPPGVQPPPVPRKVAAAPKPRPAPKPAPAPAPKAIYTLPPTFGRVATCCWPIGEPGTRGFRFCDDPAQPGRPYCAEHVKLAYVRVRDRREDAYDEAA
jgi:GcrA cell cycle regulator